MNVDILMKMAKSMNPKFVGRMAQKYADKKGMVLPFELEELCTSMVELSKEKGLAEGIKGVSGLAEQLADDADPEKAEKIKALMKMASELSDNPEELLANLIKTGTEDEEIRNSAKEAWSNK